MTPYQELKDQLAQVEKDAARARKDGKLTVLSAFHNTALQIRKQMHRMEPDADVDDGVDDMTDEEVAVELARAILETADEQLHHLEKALKRRKRNGMLYVVG